MSDRVEPSRANFPGEGDDSAALRRYRTLVDAIDDGIYQLDADGRFVAVNDSVLDATGYAREDLLGEHATEVLAERDFRRIEREIAARLESGERDGEPFEVTVRAADGTAVPFELRLSLLVDDGEFEGSVGVVREVTERERAEAIADRRERDRELELFRVLLDHSTDSVLVVDPDTGRYLDVNETACRRRGYSREELLDLSVSDVETDLPDQEAWQSFVDDLRAEGEITFDGRHRRKDGTTYPVEVNAVHVELEREYVLAVSRDVSDRRERERELERKERRYEAVFDDPNILVGLLEPDGTVLDINRTAMEYIDADLDEVTGEPFWETPWWGEGEDVRADAREWTERAAAGEYVDFRADLTRPDGERYVVEGTFRPVTDDDGEVVSIIVSDRDVTERTERERELRRYERILETIDEGVYVLDGDSRFEMVNESFAEMLGRDREALLGEHASAVFHEEKVERAEQFQRDMIAGETDIAELEEHVKAGDGETPVVTRISLFETRDEIGRVGVVRDVTRRNERKRELRRNKEQLETLFEVLPVGVVVAEADGEIIEANDNAREIWGGDVFDAGSVEEYDRYPVRWADSGDRVEPPEMTLPRVLRGEEVQEPDVVEIDAADGERRIIEAAGMPIRDDAGDVVRGVITLSDVTERKEAQRRLAESERRYRTLVEHFPDGAVGLFTEDLEYTVVGGRLLDRLDVDPEDRSGSSLSELHPEGLVDQLEPHYRAAFEGETDAFEFEYEDRQLHAQTLPVRNAAGEVSAGMIVVQDVTERREYERKLEESNERLEEFAYAASHDLQEPLRMVSSYLELIERRYADELDEDGEEFLEFALNGADRMREMIEGLLAYSRVDTRGDPFEPVELGDVFADVREDLQVKIRESDAEVTAGTLPRVEGDPGQLRQLFQNLIDNAIEYSGDERPRVRVAAERAGDRWTVSVSDEGIGIDPDQTDRIFEVFQRLQTRGDHDGTGIGLALCERIVERHGGDIRVESEPGEGTTFSFTLPAADDPEA